MSQQRSLGQKRAEAAWNCIVGVKEDNEKLKEEKRYAKEYGSLARSGPAEVQTNGLGQTLAFWRAKGYEQGQPKKDNAHAKLFAHVSAQIRGQLGLPGGNDVVVWIAEKASTEAYRRATAEAIAFLIWLKRFAEAELPKESR
jgi:CRISPR-associated protein Cmr5